jgi:hypothetical protein
MLSGGYGWIVSLLLESQEVLEELIEVLQAAEVRIAGYPF